MLYAYKNEVYIIANSKYYKLKLDAKGNLVITGDVVYDLPQKVLITNEKAKEMLGAKRSNETPKKISEEY